MYQYAYSNVLFIMTLLNILFVQKILLMKTAFQNNHLRFISLLLLFLYIAVLSGCAGKKTVTYVPREIRSQNLVPKKTKKQAGFFLHRNDPVKAKLTRQYADWQGAKYKRGGMTQQGIDCSGFVQVTFENLFQKTLPRTVKDQAKMGQPISRKTLKAGDLVFFKTGIRQKHVGIYLENGSFMHVSLSRGLMVSKLSDVYWNRRYWKAKRLLQSNQLAVSSTHKF